MLFFSEKNKDEKSKNSKNNAEGNLAFGMAVGRFILSHTELLAHWSRLRADDAAREAEKVASAAQELAAAIEELNAAVEETTASHQEITHLTATNQDHLQAMNRMLDNLSGGITSVAHQLNEVGERLQQINAIGEQVANIADQTNLLALNAAIEAARAGDHGRGFAVVAQEVRKLAASTKEAVSTVKQLAAEMRNLSATARQNSNSVEQSFAEYTRQVKVASENIEASTRHIESAAQAVENISSAISQITATAEQLAKSSTYLAMISNFGQQCSTNAGHIRQYAAPVLEAMLNNLPEITVYHTLAARLYDHARFLDQVIAQTGSGGNVVDHHHCAFGKWYHGEGSSRYGHLTSWQALDTPHRLVHKYGAQLVKETSAETVARLAEASLQLLQQFIALKEEINRA